MRKKITSLSVLLLSGAFLLTSCVKDEELDSTKNLRTAKETREAEKLAEEKALAELEKKKQELANGSVEFAQLEAKQKRIQELAARQSAILGEIATAQNLIKDSQLANAGREAKKALLEDYVAQVQKQLEQDITEYTRQITAKEQQKATLESATFEDISALLERYRAKKQEKESQNVAAAVKKDAYDQERASVTKTLTDALVATDLMKVFYKNSGNSLYKSVTYGGISDITSYVRFFRNRTQFSYKNQDTQSLIDRFIPVYQNEEGSKVGELFPLRTLETQNLPALLTQVEAVEAYVSTVTAAEAALATAETAWAANKSDATLYSAVGVKQRDLETAQDNLYNFVEAYLTTGDSDRSDFQAYRNQLRIARNTLSSNRNSLYINPANTAYQTAYNTAKTELQNKTTELENRFKVRAIAQAKAQEVRAAYTVLNTADNVTAANAPINTYNNALAGLAEKYVVWQEAQTKADNATSEVRALETIVTYTKREYDAEGNLRAEYTFDKDAKKQAVENLEREIAGLKQTLSTFKQTQEDTKKTNITNNATATEKANVVIAAQEAIVAAKTAELNYVKAQLTALGVQQ